MMADKKRSKEEEKIPAVSAKIPKKRGRKPKPKGFPKRPLSAYNWFFKEERKAVLDLDFQTMGREISSRWKKTSKEERERFEAMAAQDTERYKNEVEAYEEEQVLKAKQERVMNRSREDKTKASITSRRSTKGTILSLDKGPNATTQYNENAGKDNAAPILAAAKNQAAMDDYNYRALSLQHGMSAPSELASLVSANAQRQQIDRFLLSNELQAIESRALRASLAYGTIPQVYLPMMTNQLDNTAMLVEILRRQHEGYGLAYAEDRALESLRFLQGQENNLSNISGALHGGVLVGGNQSSSLTQLQTPQGLGGLNPSGRSQVGADSESLLRFLANSNRS